ncbi:golgin subfamily A member 6-like protein 6 [Palaemon carinicauda]|uniref:golgin subfamily A member 6-like protein 6 n=1 Tax=Palaemon carinicauda TaxID=392227 RepID=UPI0035B665A2
MEAQLEKKKITHTEDEKSIRDDSGRLVRMAIEQKNKKKKDDENYEQPLELHKELMHHKQNVLEEELEKKTQQKLAIARKQLELSRNCIGVLKEEIAELDQKQEVRNPQLSEETTRRMENLERKLLEKNGQVEALQATINSQGLQIEKNQTVINRLLEKMKNVDFRQVLLDEKEERLRQREAKLKSREAKHWGPESKRADSGNQRRRQWELEYYEFLVKSRQYALDNAFVFYDHGDFWLPVWFVSNSPLNRPTSEYFERLSQKHSVKCKTDWIFNKPYSFRKDLPKDEEWEIIQRKKKEIIQRKKKEIIQRKKKEYIEKLRKDIAFDKQCEKLGKGSQRRDHFRRLWPRVFRVVKFRSCASEDLTGDERLLAEKKIWHEYAGGFGFIHWIRRKKLWMELKCELCARKIWDVLPFELWNILHKHLPDEKLSDKATKMTERATTTEFVSTRGVGPKKRSKYL